MPYDSFALKVYKFPCIGRHLLQASRLNSIGPSLFLFLLSF